MATAKLFYKNILDLAAVTVTSENASFPLYRVYDRDIGALFKGNTTPSLFRIWVRQKKFALLHLNGSNGSQIITDEYGSAWTVGTATLSTATPKFGQAKLIIPDASGFLKNTTITHLGNLFTIEGWFYFSDYTVQGQNIFHACNAGGYGVRLQYNVGGNTKLSLSISSDGATWNIVENSLGAKTAWANDTWYKIIIELNGTNYKVYIGEAGSPVTADITVASAAVPCLLTQIIFGNGTDTVYLRGGLDEIRLALNTYRYGTTITPETVEFLATDQGDVLEATQLIIPASHNLYGLRNFLQWSTDNFVSVTFALDWWQSGSGQIAQSFSTQTKMFWRLTVMDSINPPELSEIFLGAPLTLGINPEFGNPFGKKENVNRWEVQSGLSQRIKNGEPRKQYRCAFAVVTAAQKADLEAWRDSCDGVKPFYYCDTDGNWVYVERLGDLQFVPISYGNFATSFDLLEVLA